MSCGQMKFREDSISGSSCSKLMMLVKRMLNFLAYYTYQLLYFLPKNIRSFCSSSQFCNKNIKAIDFVKTIRLNGLSASDYVLRCYELLGPDHSVYSIFEKTAGYVINRCLQTHMPFRG